MDKIPLINPESGIKIIWDVIISMVRVYFLILFPLDLCFPNIFIFHYPNVAFCFVITLIMDQLISFNTIIY